MSGLEVVAFISAIFQIQDVVKSVAQRFYRSGSSIIFFTKTYGLAGPILWGFGSQDVWRIEVQVLRSTNEQDAMDFKRSAQDDSNIIAVAGTIIAQIAITALSLANLSKTHWVARAFFTFSLVSAIMAVYYATRQYRILGRCLRPDQIKTWIRSKPSRASRGVDPRRQYLLPSPASVLTISAPNMLLSSSLNSFLIGLGVYLGFVWTRNLDELAGSNDSRDVFITYVIGLAFCYGIYALSGAVADKSYSGMHDLLGDADGLHATVQKVPAGETTSQNDSNRPAEHVLMQASNVDLEMASSSTSPGADPKRTRQSTLFQDDSLRQELLQAFRDAAKLRKEITKVDERLVRLLERLG